MKKTFIFAIFLLIFSALLSGCASTNNNTGNAGNNSAAARSFGRPDFGQPDRPADISGLVKSITGNEVTIIKIDRPNRASGTPADANANGNNANNNDQASAVNPRALFGGGGGGAGGFVRGGQGGRAYGGGDGGPEGDNSQTRTAMLDRLKAMSSGDEKVIIPVGIKMLKPDISAPGSNTSANQGQPNMVEATLADITSDKMVQVWLDPSVTDRKVAEFVLITR